MHIDIGSPKNHKSVYNLRSKTQKQRYGSAEYYIQVFNWRIYRKVINDTVM